MPIKEHLICEKFRWIDITGPTQNEMDEISKEHGLDQHLVRDCMEPAHLPKYDVIDDVHFLILRFYVHTSNSQVSTIQDLTNKIAIFYTDNLLITIRIDTAQFIDVIRNKYVVTSRCTSIPEIVTKILWNALESFDDPAQRLSERVDFYENHIVLKRKNIDHVEALYFIKRQASISNKVMMLMLEPINHIRTVPDNDAALQDVKDQHLKIQTLYNQILEDVNNLMNLYMSFSAQKTNDVMKILTIFSVFFMPLTFIVGVYGMNFEFMPELSKKWGYPAVLLLMIGITIGIYSWFRRKKWL